jgi:hypothetical protein
MIAFAAEYMPDEHGVILTSPVVAQYEPALQAAQDDLPEVGLYCPESQGKQLLVAAFD